jgi:phosphohistidine phosphatase
MKLYFLRHGIAADVGPAGTGDAGRPLTKEGIEKMQAEARGLARMGVRPEVLLSSPLVRARETAEIVARELGLEVQLVNALAAGADTRRLLDLLGQHRRAESVMVVGHEPDFSRMIGDLTGGSQVVLKKGGLGRVDLDVLERGGGALAWLLPPKVLIEVGQ